MDIAFIRHGPTAWSTAKRLQGRTDVALSASGHDEVRNWVLPDRVANWPRFCSPLLRTQQTAQLLTPPAPASIAPALIEASFGDYEGQSIAQLRTTLGQTFTDNESRGLDFLPPHGESPRQVCERLSHWFAQLASTAVAPAGVVAISHKGVIRAVLSLATGWDMKTVPPVKLEWQHLHRFRYDHTDGGHLSVIEVNVPLVAHARP